MDAAWEQIGDVLEANAPHPRWRSSARRGGADLVRPPPAAAARGRPGRAFALTAPGARARADRRRDRAPPARARASLPPSPTSAPLRADRAGPARASRAPCRSTRPPAARTLVARINDRRGHAPRRRRPRRPGATVGRASPTRSRRGGVPGRWVDALRAPPWLPASRCAFADRSSSSSRCSCWPSASPSSCAVVAVAARRRAARLARAAGRRGRAAATRSTRTSSRPPPSTRCRTAPTSC